MDNRSNDVLFEEGMKKAKELISGHLYNVLTKCCDLLVTEAPNLANGFMNFTGNTITSYTAGLYIDGALNYVVCAGEHMKAPVRMKLKKGEYAYLTPDYDGRERGFKGTIETDAGYGWQTALNFLQRYKSESRKGFEIVVCTGTEYSTYLENARGADVLTGLFTHAESILSKNIKTMK